MNVNRLLILSVEVYKTISSRNHNFMHEKEQRNLQENNANHI